MSKGIFCQVCWHYMTKSEGILKDNILWYWLRVRLWLNFVHTKAHFGSYFENNSYYICSFTMTISLGINYRANPIESMVTTSWQPQINTWVLRKQHWFWTHHMHHPLGKTREPFLGKIMILFSYVMITSQNQWPIMSKLREVTQPKHYRSLTNQRYTHKPWSMNMWPKIEISQTLGLHVQFTCMLLILHL